MSAVWSPGDAIHILVRTVSDAASGMTRLISNEGALTAGERLLEQCASRFPSSSAMALTLANDPFPVGMRSATQTSAAKATCAKTSSPTTHRQIPCHDPESALCIADLPSVSLGVRQFTLGRSRKSPRMQIKPVQRASPAEAVAAHVRYLVIPIMPHGLQLRSASRCSFVSIFSSSVRASSIASTRCSRRSNRRLYAARIALRSGCSVPR